MSSQARESIRPVGGLQASRRLLRRWRWAVGAQLRSAPVRCRAEQWYLARATPGGSLCQPAGAPGRAVPERATRLLLRFLKGSEAIEQRCVPLRHLDGAADGEPLLGWVQSPEQATHVQVCLPRGDLPPLERLELHPIADCDPVCHPLANVPSWDRYQPASPPRCVFVPPALAGLKRVLSGLRVEPLAQPGSWKRLLLTGGGGAFVLDDTLVRALGLRLADLERIAADTWVLLGLESFATLLNRGRRRIAQLVTYVAEHEIMSARIEYADGPTRGFALQDVVPFASVDGTRFRTRALRATVAWKRYARQSGFVTLLASETPWENRCGDVLSATRVAGRGRVLVSDLPWLVAGRHGRLLAPRLAEHLLRMHLGLPLDEAVQYWTRLDECDALLRDIADLPRRFPPLRAVRWVSDDPHVVRLGVTLPAAGRPRAHLLICTGRIDSGGLHDGVPPEPMLIFVRYLVRQRNRQSAWARRFLDPVTVTWQFDTACGLRHAPHYESAVCVAGVRPRRTLIVRSDAAGPDRQPGTRAAETCAVLTVPADAGIFGDRSLEYQAELTSRLRAWIEQANR